MGSLSKLVISLAAALSMSSAVYSSGCRYQDMNSVGLQGGAPFYELECVSEARDGEPAYDISFAFSIPDCSCNPRLRYSEREGAAGTIERVFEMDFELEEGGSMHANAVSGRIDSIGEMWVYDRRDPRGTMRRLPAHSQCSPDDQVIWDRAIGLFDFWVNYFDPRDTLGGPLMQRMYRVCIEDGITSEARSIQDSESRRGR